jgi:hypothetical protein
LHLRAVAARRTAYHRLPWAAVERAARTRSISGRYTEAHDEVVVTVPPVIGGG